MMPPPNERAPLPPAPLPPIPLSDVGAALVRLRQDRGLLQKELAERIGVLPQSLNRMEQTQYRGVAVERLAQVAAALGIQLLVYGAVSLASPAETDTRNP